MNPHVSCSEGMLSVLSGPVLGGLLRLLHPIDECVQQRVFPHPAVSRTRFSHHASKLDFPQSGDIAARLGEAFEEGARDFHHLRALSRHAKRLM